MKRLDRAAALLAAAGAAFCLLFHAARRDEPATCAEIIVNGKIVERLPLAGPARDVTVSSEGGVNVVRVGGGRAAVVSSDCPDLVCVRSGEISRPGQGSVCLPHKLAVRITGGKNGGVDAVSE